MIQLSLKFVTDQEVSVNKNGLSFTKDLALVLLWKSCCFLFYRFFYQRRYILKLCV